MEIAAPRFLFNISIRQGCTSLKGDHVTVRGMRECYCVLHYGDEERQLKARCIW